MYWFYPILSGALTGETATRRIEKYWKKYVIEGPGGAVRVRSALGDHGRNIGICACPVRHGQCKPCPHRPFPGYKSAPMKMALSGADTPFRT